MVVGGASFANPPPGPQNLTLRHCELETISLGVDLRRYIARY